MKSLKRKIRLLREFLRLVFLPLIIPAFLWLYFDTLEINPLIRLTFSACVTIDGKLQLADLNAPGVLPAISADPAASPPRKTNASSAELRELLSEEGYITPCYTQAGSGKLHSGSLYTNYILLIFGVLIWIMALFLIAPVSWRRLARGLNGEELPPYSRELAQKGLLLAAGICLTLVLMKAGEIYLADITSRAWVATECSIVGEHREDNSISLVYQRSAGPYTYRSSSMNGIGDTVKGSTGSAEHVPPEATVVDCFYNPDIPSQMKLAMPQAKYWGVVQAFILAFIVVKLLNRWLDKLEARAAERMKAQALKNGQI